jgi:hypothetical protein
MVILFVSLFFRTVRSEDGSIGCTCHKLEQDRASQLLLLLSPGKGTVITEGPIVFRWESSGDPDASNFHDQRYEITFWSEKTGFRRTFSIIPEDSSESIIILRFEDARTVFKRHGTYYWRVSAFDAEEHKTSSGISQFSIGLSDNVKKGSLSWVYPYAVQFQYSHRYRSEEYVDFLDTINPTTSMRSYSDAGFIFRQEKVLFSFLELQERLLILSQIGIGYEISSRLKIIENQFFGMYPQGGVMSSWFSTGLKDYSSTCFSANLGCDLVIMPNSNLIIRGSWIPVYRIRYALKNGELRTFQGEGWEIGLRILISHKIINTFRILNLEIDLQRIPLEFHLSRIRDEYTGTLMEVKRMSIGFLIQ